MRLLNVATGELVRGRCRATNLCLYCRILYVVETAEMLALDAMEWAPTLALTLTAREHLQKPDVRRHLAKLLKLGRREWPGLAWHVQTEFQKRGALHLHMPTKGVPVEEAAALLELLGGLWCSRVDAEMSGQNVIELTDAGGFMRYLAKELAHGLKAEQAPPLGWKGHRTSQTRNYLVRPAAVMREEARAALRLKREIWRVLVQEPDLDALTVEEVAHAALAARQGQSWRMVSTPLRKLGRRDQPASAAAARTEGAG